MKPCKGESEIVYSQGLFNGFGAILELERCYFGPPREDFRSLIELKTPNEECVFFVAVEEARKLIESEFEYVCTFEDVYAVQKRKIGCSTLKIGRGYRTVAEVRYLLPFGEFSQQENPIFLCVPFRKSLKNL